MSDAERETNKFIDETAEKWTKREEQENRETFRERISKPVGKIHIDIIPLYAIDMIRALADSAYMNVESDKRHAIRCLTIAQNISEILADEELGRITGRAAEKEMDRYF